MLCVSFRDRVERRLHGGSESRARDVDAARGRIAQG